MANHWIVRRPGLYRSNVDGVLGWVTRMSEAHIYDNQLDADMQAGYDNKGSASDFGRSRVRPVEQVLIWKEVCDEEGTG